MLGGAFSFGLSNSISKAATRAISIKNYIKDNLRIYFDFKNTDLEFVGTGSAYFDGTGDYIEVEHDLAVDTNYGTVMFWIKRLSSDTVDYYVDFRGTDGDQTSGGHGILYSSSTSTITVNSFSSWYKRYRNGAETTNFRSYPVTSASFDGWEHICVTGMNLKITDNGFNIGARYDNGSNTNMYMKNFAVWERDLSASEVQSIMYKTYAELQNTEKTGLKGWWALESDANDSHGSYHGAAISHTSFSATIYKDRSPKKPRGFDNAPTAQADLIGSGSLSLTASSYHHVNLGKLTELDNIADFSMACWINAPNTGGTHAIWSNYKDGNEAMTLLVNGNHIMFQNEAGSDNFNRFDYDDVDNEWHHIAVTYDGSGADNAAKCKMYLDGALQTNDFDGTLPALTDDLSGYDSFIGRRGTSYSGCNIAQLGIWTRVITQEEVQSIKEKTYSDLSTSEKTTLLSWWGLDVNFEDEHGDNDGTPYSDTAIVSNSTAATFANSPQKTGEPLDHAKLYSGKALEFDGVSDYAQIDYTHTDESFTVAFWVMLHSTPANNYVSSVVANSYNHIGFYGSRTIYWRQRNDLGNAWCWDANDNQTGSTALSLNTWHRVVCIHNKSRDQRVYIDGAPGTGDATNGVYKEYTGSISTSSTYGYKYIGKAAAGNFDGKICDLQIWRNIAWSSDDVEYDYKNPEKLVTSRSGTNTTTAHLNRWYPMNDTGVTNPQTVIFDAAGTNNTTKTHATTTFLGDNIVRTTTSDGTSATLYEAYSSNTTEVDSDTIKITYVDSANGALVRLKESSGALTEDLVVGKQYRLTADIKVNSGSVNWYIVGPNVFLKDGLTDTDFTTYSVDFTAVHATSSYLRVNAMGSGEIAFIDNLTVKEIGIASGWTDANQQQTIPQTALMNGSVKSFIGNGLYSNSIPSLSYPFTLSCWLYKTDDAAYGVYLVDKDASNIYFGIALGADDKVYLQASNTSNKNTNSNSTYTNQWVHVVASFESATDRNLYINGSPNTDNENNDSVTYENIDRISVGYMGDSSPTYSGSEIIVDEVCVFSTGLNDSEALELYNSGAPLNATKHSLGNTNLVGYWQNNQLESTGKWKDQVSTNHLTANDTPSTIFFQEGVTANLDTQGMNTTIDHPSNGAAWFDGITSYIDLIRDIEIEGDYTVMLWFKADDVAVNYIWAPDGTTNYFRIGDEDTFLLKSNGSNVTFDLNDGTDIGYNQWHHLALVRDSGTITLYFDSTAQTDTEADTATLKIKYLGVRGAPTTAAHYFRGMLDEFFLYDKAFTSAQILKNYKHGKSKHKN